MKNLPKINQTKNLKQDDVVLFRDVYRKISGNIDIVCQLYLKDKDSNNLQVIGKIDRHNYIFADDPIKSFSISDIPSSAIIRNKICLDVSIVDIHMIKMRYI